MCKCFIPFAHAESVYEIDMDFFKQLKIKTVLIDLDNTLDSYKLFIPTQKAKDLINKFHENNIDVIVVSNNKGKRVSSYASALNIPYVNSARKPFPKKLNNFIKTNNLSRNELIFIGDQMMTDVLAAHNAHIRMILTEKIVKEDQWTTHINRIFDRPIRAFLRKKGKLKDWREIYGNC